MTVLIVLGMLSYDIPLTIYDIKKSMEESTQFFMSTSLGSLHPCLKKLENKQWVTVEKRTEKNRLKKYYQITDRGKEALDDLMREDLGPDRIRIGLLLKLFYFHRLSTAEQVREIDQYLERQRATLAHLNQIDREADARLAEHGETRDTFAAFQYQMDALHFGVAYQQFQIDWFEAYKQTLLERSSHENDDF